MKIFDIISEAQPVDREEMKRRRDRAAELNKQMRDTASAREKAAADSAARRQKVADIKQQKPVAMAVRDVKKYITGRQSNWRSNQNAANATQEKWMKLFGTKLVTLMRVLGLVGPLTYLYLDLDSWEQEYVKGGWTREQYEEGREFLFGMFMTQVLTPIIIRRLSQLSIVLWIVRGIRYLVAGATGVVTGGATVAAVVATEGFFIWLQYFLSTSAGKDWLVNFLGTNVIRTMGKIPEGAWSSLTDAYQKSDQAKLKKQDPTKAAEVEKQQKQQASDLEKSREFAKTLGLN